jgi:hypothetical protein
MRAMMCIVHPAVLHVHVIGGFFRHFYQVMEDRSAGVYD